MPLARHPLAAAPEPSASANFVDRQTESAAISDALLAHVRRCNVGEVDGEVFRNVVTFYGDGGVGKSALSNRAELWLGSGVMPEGWQYPPRVPNLAVARWELNQSSGNVDVVPLLIAVRAALYGQKRSWPAFDLAFAAYFSSVRPDENVPSVGSRDTRFADGFLSILSDIATDVGYGDTVVGFGSSLIRGIVQASAAGARRWRGAQTNPEIMELVLRCLTEPSTSDQAPHLAAEVLWQLALEMDTMALDERPNLVVFVDHFERVQKTKRGQAESTINRLIAALPHALFIVTGRDLVDWYRPDRTDLPIAGAIAWPGLLPNSSEEARQHLLGRLSYEDTCALLSRHSQLEGLRLAPGVIEHVAKSSGGLPLHIDAVATYARRIREVEPSRVIGVGDLGGSLGAVVKKLIDHLPSDERRAFQAACVLPFFDVDLVRATSPGVDAAAVTRFAARALVLDNPNSAFPYRIHDEIRMLVKAHSSEVAGGWSATDWHEAVGRALDFAREKITEAEMAEDDHAQLMSIALAIQLVTENGFDPGWIPAAVKAGPTITGLRPHIPASDKVAHISPSRGIIEFIEALDTPANQEVIDELDRLTSDPFIGAQASLWAAYRVRVPLHRHEEAVKRFRVLRERHPERSALFDRQIAVTWAQCRRFKDELEHGELLAPDVRARLDGQIRRSHGDLSATRLLEERVKSITSSRRYRTEVAGTLAVTYGRAGRNSLPTLQLELDRVRKVGHRSAERDYLRAIGYLLLYRSAEFEDVLQQLRMLERLHGESSAEAELLALRALATGRQDLAIRSRQLCAQAGTRTASWIGVEFFLEQLGMQLDETPTQWVQPLDRVRSQWKTISTTIIDRAGNLA